MYKITTIVKGFKVLNPDYTCRDFKYEVGKTYKMDNKPKCCEEGFHFCLKAVDCFNYYGFNPENKVVEVEALGIVDYAEDNTKCATNEIKIVKEFNWNEVLNIVNEGRGNSGCSNQGNRNSGCNNEGDFNSGCSNQGDYNSGDSNQGNRNSGKYNQGDYNSVDSNQGDYNSGFNNQGNRNSGDFNKGHRNSGDNNQGDYNSGNYNISSYNSGDFNISEFNVGCFNTQDYKVRFFDKETDTTLKEWRCSKAYNLLHRIKISSWISESAMTDIEKTENPAYKIRKGYLKQIGLKEACKIWWEQLTEEEKELIVTEIPNFDTDKFYEITGVNTKK